MNRLINVAIGQSGPGQQPAGPLSAGGQSSAMVGTRILVGIYLLFLSIYLMSAAGHFFTTDHVAVYLTTQSLVERHALAIKPILDTARGRDGHYYSTFGLGQSIAEIPLYLVGKAVEGIRPPALQRYFGGVNLGDWGGTVPIFFVSLLNQLVTPLTCVMVFLFCVRLGFARRTALATTLIYGLATMTWVYARDSFQHPLETLLLLSCVYILFANRANLRPRHALCAGMALALGILTNINLLLVAPAIAIYLCYIAEDVLITEDRIARGVSSGQQVRQVRTYQVLGIVAINVPELSFQGVSYIAFRYLLVVLMPVVLVLGVIMSLNYLKFGTVWTFEAPAQATGFSTPLWVGLYGNLFSAGRSIFLYSPPTLLALYAFRPFYRKHRAEALLFLSIIALYLFVYSQYGSWDGGWAWGPRFLVAIIPFLIIPVGYVFASGQRTTIVALVACLGIGVQILGVMINYSFVYWDWIYMKLSPANAFLFQLDISPIPTHLRDLLQGRHIDVWLLEVYQQFGVYVFLATLAVPLAVLAKALALLGHPWPSLPRSWLRASSVALRNGSQGHAGDLQRDSASARLALGLTGAASSFGKPSVPWRYSGADARRHLHTDENVAADATVIQTRPPIEVRGALNPVLAVWRRLGREWQLGIWLLVTLRIALGLVAVLSIHLNPLNPAMMQRGSWHNLLIHGGEPWSEFLSTWQRWDAYWYQHIAEQGYRAGDSTTAFYPLYPLLSRIVSLPLGGQVVLAELLVSSAAFLVSMALLYRIARLDSGPLASRLAILLTAFFPTGFFLLAPYTESLYLALSLAAFWLARRGRPWAAGLAGFGAALTRVPGVFLALPLAFEYTRQRHQQGKRPGLGLLAAALPALGFIAVNAYYHLVVGERGSLLALQSAFGYRIVPPWEALAASWVHIVSSGDIIEALNLVCLVGFGLLALVLMFRHQIGYALYVVPYLALLFTRQMWYSPLMSVSRLTLVLFPCFILVAMWLARQRWLAAGWLVFSLLLQVMLLEYYVHFGFVA